MHIQRIHLHQFRNIESFDSELHPVVNVVHGRNAQGKTNLLEAISLLATMKSFRAARTAELVRWDQPEAAIGASIVRHDVTRKMVMRIKAGSRVVHIDSKRASSLQETYGHVHAVLFAPEDLAISKGSGRGRRVFLDRAIFSVVPVFLEETRSYDQALRSRNALLRDASGRGPDPAVMAVFDAQLVAAGARVTRRRFEFVAAFRDRVSGIHEGLCEGRHSFSMRYQSSFGAVEGEQEEQMAARFREALAASRRRDAARRVTSLGPQTDDLLVEIDERPARIHASQGQHRTIVLALKLAEIDHVEHALGLRPVLLLDDVSSELDRQRNAQLLEHLDRSLGQVVVTTTDPAYLVHRGQALHFHVEQGRIEPSARTQVAGSKSPARMVDSNEQQETNS